MSMYVETPRMPRLRLFLLLLASLLAFGTVRAQEDESPRVGESVLPPVTRTFAIRNARIVQAPGRVIERGTVVVRDGLIVAVGPNVAIPYDAQIIEGDSLWVYAGFIDGLSHVGVPKPKEESKPEKVKRPGDPPNDRAGIQPERDVRDMLRPDDPSVDSLRMAGFTVAHAVPRGQMLPGSGAIVVLAGEKPNEMVLRGGASAFAQFEPALGDVYPATTFAIMAKWRTLYRNAERLERQGTIYSQDPSGISRPPYDAVVDAFFPIIDGKRPVFFRAESALDVHRAIKLHDDLGFPLVVADLKEGWDVPAKLKSSGVPVFLSLDFPREKQEKGKDSASTDSLATADSLRQHKAHETDDQFLRDDRTLSYRDVTTEKDRLEARQASSRAQYYANAARMRRAGLTFGFSTLGASAGQLRENLRLAVENGLPEDAALAALTVDAAKILGLQGSMGTVEPGKMANLVLTTGSYFDKNSQVRYVFADGRKFEYEAEKKSSDSGAAESEPKTALRSDTLLMNPALAGRRDATRRGNALIKNGTVLTVTKGTLEHTDILVENGKIAKIGQGLIAPAGYDTIDATGEYVMPGIIDAHSHIATTDVNEWTNPVTAEVAIRDVLDPYDLSIYRALAGGKTIAHVMHGSANVIGGQCQTIKMRYGTTDPEGLVMEGAPRTIKFALGENPTRVHGRGFGVNPSTRMGVEQVMRDAFTQAQRYMAAQKKYEEEKKKNPRAVPPPYDLRMETLAGILRGEILINCHSYRADEILMTMRVLHDFGVKKITFQHVNEGFKIAPELAAFGAGASVFSDWWAYKFEVYYSTAYNAAILTRNGVVTSINSDSPELDRHLYHEASKTRKYGGLSDDEALALITINPARQLGIEEHVGSIEVGKDADLAIFTAHPLSIYAICRKTLVDGVVRFDRDNDPDDMRLQIDPKTPVETATVYHGDEDECMRGTDGLLDLLMKN